MIQGRIRGQELLAAGAAATSLGSCETSKILPATFEMVFPQASGVNEISRFRKNVSQSKLLLPRKIVVTSFGHVIDRIGSTVKRKF
jgi:hypothetical protein